MNKILLTGATGFVGTPLLSALLSEGFHVGALVRTENTNISVKTHNIPLSPESDYSSALIDKDIVIHCAARVHMMDDHTETPLDDFRKVNSLGTAKLAKQAAASGVKRFIFLSTVKVNGEETFDKAFSPNDTPKPEDDYSVSKAEAERLLLNIANDTGMEVVIVRPPLIYGPDVKGNFQTLINHIYKGLPLPFGMLNKNRRSLLFVDNLVDFIITTVKATSIPNSIYMVADDTDISTADLIHILSANLSSKGINISVPIVVFRIIGALLGKKKQVERLVGSLVVDISDSKKDLNWSPPVSFQEGIEITARQFLRLKREE